MIDEKKLLELTRIIHEMVLEVGELKERIALLEGHIQENQPPPPPQPEVEVDEAIKRRLQGENYENLGHLYHSGYHVCSEFFGQVLDGDCLFCVALMEKK